MSQKTFISSIEQWDRTVAYWTQHFHNGDTEYAETCEWGWESEHYNDWLLGVITKPSKLFNAGDLVITSRNNGSADRFYMYAVSSKGYSIKHMYLPFTESGDSLTLQPLSSIRSLLHATADASVKHRLVYIPDPPFMLAGRSPYDSQVRDYVTALIDGTAETITRAAALKVNTLSVSLVDTHTGLRAQDPSRPDASSYMINYSELGIDTQLAKDLQAWVMSRGEIGKDGKYLTDAQLDQQGILLAKRVRQALGDHIQVVYAALDKSETPIHL